MKRLNNKFSFQFRRFKKLKVIVLFILLLSLFFSFKSLHINENLNETPDERSWETQLNEMNYLVMRASSINIIYGLHLTTKQAKDLKALAEKFESLDLSIPDTKGDVINELSGVRKTYISLIEHLEEKKPISDSLKNNVLSMRILESDMIKRTVLGSKSAYNENKCLKCHAHPQYFPKGDISNRNTQAIPDKLRVKIDVAHVKGLFFEEGTQYLWEHKSDVDMILTNGQKYMTKGFRCCLLPPDNLNDPTNIGQAAVSNEWIEYLNEVRVLSHKNWENYKQLYIYPIEDIVEATLPGIKNKYKKQIIKKVEIVIEDAREMDRIDFELQKKELCVKLQDALNIDFLIGEDDRQQENRQFLAAMFLLFPGSVEIYDDIIKSDINP